MIYYIYALIYPTDNRIRYIGKTNNLNKRLNKHISECKKSMIFELQKINGLKSLLDKNIKAANTATFQKPQKKKLINLKFEYIKEYRGLIPDLTNDTDGGERP
jgi:predicted GIY-YIG superfamily endonuclease